MFVCDRDFCNFVVMCLRVVVCATYFELLS